MKNKLILTILLACLSIVVLWLYFGRTVSIKATSSEKSLPRPISVSIGKSKDVRASERNLASETKRITAEETIPKRNGTEITSMARSFHQIHLTPDQIAILQKCYDKLVIQRETIELRLAQRDEIKNGEVLISIPAYIPEGAELENSFNASVVQALGDSAAKEFLAAVGSSIWTDNNYYGQRAHQILIDDTGNGYHIYQAWLGPNGKRLSGASGDIGYEIPDVFGYLRAMFPKPRK